jgi:hypothetical protein
MIVGGSSSTNENIFDSFLQYFNRNNFDIDIKVTLAEYYPSSLLPAVIVDFKLLVFVVDCSRFSIIASMIYWYSRIMEDDEVVDKLRRCKKWLLCGDSVSYFQHLDTIVIVEQNDRTGTFDTIREFIK